MSQNADVHLLVTADDRTGAYETAAALADHGAGPVGVHVWPDAPDADADDSFAVVDLGSRHLPPSEAAERAAHLPAPGRYAHKIDSTLRGNWAEELVGRQRVTGQPVLLIPALPALGRTCVGGIVLDHGRPVHEGTAATDVRRRVVTSRPADTLRSADAGVVTELAGGTAVDDWLTDPSGIAVVDAIDDATIAEAVERWSAVAGVALAGTSAVVGAAAATLGADLPVAAFPTIDGPILVICGSVHPSARRQIAVAEHHGIPVTHLADEISARLLRSSSALVLATEIPVGDVGAPIAVAAASGLARGACDLRSLVDLGAIVIIGGDTAAAVIGHHAVTVRGSVDAGTAWVEADAFDVPIVTRSGGFGSDHALVDLLHTTLRS